VVEKTCWRTGSPGNKNKRDLEENPAILCAVLVEALYEQGEGGGEGRA